MSVILPAITSHHVKGRTTLIAEGRNVTNEHTGQINHHTNQINDQINQLAIAEVVRNNLQLQLTTTTNTCNAICNSLIPLQNSSAQYATQIGQHTTDLAAKTNEIVELRNLLNANSNTCNALSNNLNNFQQSNDQRIASLSDAQGNILIQLTAVEANTVRMEETQNQTNRNFEAMLNVVIEDTNQRLDQGQTDQSSALNTFKQQQENENKILKRQLAELSGELKECKSEIRQKAEALQTLSVKVDTFIDQNNLLRIQHEEDLREIRKRISYHDSEISFNNEAVVKLMLKLEFKVSANNDFSTTSDDESSCEASFHSFAHHNSK